MDQEPCTPTILTPEGSITRSDNQDGDSPEARDSPRAKP